MLGPEKYTYSVHFPRVGGSEAGGKSTFPQILSQNGHITILMQPDGDQEVFVGSPPPPLTYKQASIIGATPLCYVLTDNGKFVDTQTRPPSDSENGST